MRLRSRPDDRCRARGSHCARERGKSELRRAVRRVTPGQGDLKESGTENTPPLTRPGTWRAVRVKRCGKSAPRPWQHGWQAKPRTEQDQIGRRSRTARPKPPGRSLDFASDGEARGMVVKPVVSMGRTEFGLRLRCDLFPLRPFSEAPCVASLRSSRFCRSR